MSPYVLFIITIHHADRFYLRNFGVLLPPTWALATSPDPPSTTTKSPTSETTSVTNRSIVLTRLWLGSFNRLSLGCLNSPRRQSAETCSARSRQMAPLLRLMHKFTCVIINVCILTYVFDNETKL